MYPELYTFSFGDSTIPVMTYGLCLTLAFGLFYWMLWRLGRKYQINTAFFTVNLLAFFLITFFVSRFAHVVLFAGLPTKSAYITTFPISSFFLMSDFYFSLSGAIIGFFGFLLYLTRNKEQADRDDILDISVISWLFASIVGYVGAFLGGQTYGIRSDSIIAVDYIKNPILAEYSRFPLAIIYVICIIFIFSLCYIIKKLRPERGMAAATGAFLWGIMWFIGEWWNDASSDNFSYLFGVFHNWKIFNFNQLFALILIAWGSWRLAHIIPSPLSEWILDIGKVYLRVQSRIGKIISRIMSFLWIRLKRISRFIMSKAKIRRSTGSR